MYEEKSNPSKFYFCRGHPSSHSGLCSLTPICRACPDFPSQQAFPDLLSSRAAPASIPWRFLLMVRAPRLAPPTPQSTGKEAPQQQGLGLLYCFTASVQNSAWSQKVLTPVFPGLVFSFYPLWPLSLARMIQHKCLSTHSVPLFGVLLSPSFLPKSHQTKGELHFS